MVRFTQHDRARTYLRWLLLLFFAMPHTKRYKKYQLGRSSIIFYLYDLSTFFCPTTRRNIPWLYALFLDGSRSCCSFRLASSAPEARRRCIGRLGAATAPWSSSWSLRGPRWMRPTKTAVAPEGFSESFREWLWRGDGRGSWQVIFVLCFGMLSGIRTCCLRIHFCDGMGLLEFGYKKWDETSRKQKESRGLKVLIVFKWFWAWNKFWNCDRRMEQFLTAELPDILYCRGLWNACHITSCYAAEISGMLATLHVATLQRSPVVSLLRYMLLRCRDLLWYPCYVTCCYAAEISCGILATLHVATLPRSLECLPRYMLLRCRDLLWYPCHVTCCYAAEISCGILATLHVATLPRSLECLPRYMLLRCRDLWNACHVTCCYVAYVVGCCIAA